MYNPKNTAPPCFTCGGSKIKVEQLNETVRYTCTQCGEEWTQEVPQSAGTLVKKHHLAERYIVKNRKQALGAAALAALVMQPCSMFFITCGSFDILSAYILEYIPFLLLSSLIGGGLAAVVARWVPETLAWIILSIGLAAWAVLNGALFGSWC